MTDRENFVTAYAYDDGDNLTAYEDERELVTTFVYNGFGEVVQEVSPDRGTWSYSYDLRGLVTSVTDGRGVVSNYAYDDSGRIVSLTFPSQPALDQTYTYHTASEAPWNFARLASVEDQAGTTEFEFSAQTGDIASETQILDGVSYEVGYEYVVRGEISQITYPSGGLLNLSYDDNGNLLALEWEGIDPLTSTLLPPQTVIEDMEYAPFGGLRSATYGDGGDFTATYDLSYRPTRLYDERSSTDLRDVSYTWTRRPGERHRRAHARTGRGLHLFAAPATCHRGGAVGRTGLALRRGRQPHRTEPGHWRRARHRRLHLSRRQQPAPIHRPRRGRDADLHP